MENTFEHAFFPLTSVTSGLGQEVVSDIYCLPIQIVNIVFIGARHQAGEWVLVDAGMPNSAESIISQAEQRFGENCRPQAMILTHGHFDHVGAIVDLVKHWKVPVYAHELELPYLTGKADYPKGDSTVHGGLVSELSPLFPNQGIDLGSHVSALPHDGSVPGISGWQWIHTPGHTPGHISLFRTEDGSLIAGDAVITVKQESLLKVILQTQELHGPPAYFTTDWQAAWDSVRRIAALRPTTLVTGHGLPMYGDELADGLQILVRDFDKTEIPKQGRFVQ